MKNSIGRYTFDISILLTLALLGIAYFCPLKSMWGINHLQFLPEMFFFLYSSIVIFVVYILFGPYPQKLSDKIFANINQWLWGESILPRLFVISGCVVILYSFRIETHLLGDSFTWLAVFGQGNSYTHKMTEPGSIFILRQLQHLLGGYTEQTALTAFSILSIFSGAIYIYNFISIVGHLSSNIFIRILGLATILFSGSILLFFGYVEFYPILWACVSVFINSSLVFIKKGGSLLTVLLTYCLSVLMHLQALYFLPGVVYLLLCKIDKPIIKKTFYSLIAIGVLTAVALFVWLYQTRVDFEVLTLPLFNGRPVAPDYSIISAPHLLDIINLLLLTFPGGLVLVCVLILKTRKVIIEPVSLFLLLLSSGSLLFLITFNPVITMGRDWDLMSLSLITPTLFIIRLIDYTEITVSSRRLVVYIITIAFCTVSFLYVCINSSLAEKRYYTLLNNRNEDGWVIFANYFLLKGDNKRYNEIMNERQNRFPDLDRLKRAYRLIENGNYGNAMKIARELVDKDPYNPDYLQVLGNAYGKFSQYDSAVEYYGRAITLKPYSAETLNELGQLYIEYEKYDKAIQILKGARTHSPDHIYITESLALAYIHKRQYDSSLALAHILFANDKNSPGGHLVKMVVALWNNDRETAQNHYLEYLKYGQDRPDYESIREYYNHLIKNE